MDFLDDEAGVSEDEEILVPSSQTKENRRSAIKRRRLNTDHHPVSDDYDLPPNHVVRYGNGERDEFANQKSKYDDRIYVPQFAETQHDTFVTQPDEQWSSPSRIRGPRWKKPTTQPKVASKPGQSTSPVYRMPSTPPPRAPVTLAPPSVVDEFDDDDPALWEILMSSAAEEASRQSVEGIANAPKSQTNRSRAPPPRSTSFRQTTLYGMHTAQKQGRASQSQSRVHSWPLASRDEPPTHHQINLEAMTTWVYPTNLGRIRDYQFNIVHKGLFHNLLVALPTGLGKTFIAATVMLNWFRWTKDAQIVFVAPTKPLVSQQIDACFNIVGIPRSQTTMLTGEVPPAIRAEEWQEKRVFFMTPQTLINDLKNGMCDPKKIVLLVVDEAHKATGNYAYVEVVRFMRRFNSSFRVLALTATPGANVESVQKVIDGLDIARVEIRTEESLDIREFVHARNTELEIFDNSDEITMSLELFAAAVRPLLNKLNTQNAYWSKDPTAMTLFGLKMARDEWMKSEAARAGGMSLKGMINSIFNVLMSLAHNLELLKYHGIGPFYHKMKLFEDGEYGKGKYAKQIVEDAHFKKLMNRLRSWINEPDFVGHPKLSYLKTVVLNHFMDAADGRGRAAGRPPSDTRIMIFAHYRDSAEEITRVLNRHGPMIRAHVFVGQSGTSASEGMDQKTQLSVINKFKAGTYNTIVATSIGEEGLDIGEVDLIVCYDSSKSPIRMLQRMGRTGRKRAGNIVLLLMRGKEEADYHKAKDNYLKMQAIIESGKEFVFHEDRSPRIVPKEIVPVVDKRIVDIPVENTQAEPLEPRRRKGKNAKRPPKRFHMPDGVETGFTFLGNGKTAAGGRPRAGLSRPEPTIDQQMVALPLLTEVLLSPDEEVQLDQRYVQVAGTEDQYIQPVRFDAFPEQQQRLSRTSAIKHSSTTKKLVAAFEAMRDTGQSWSRPLVCPEIEVADHEDLSSGDSDGSHGSARRPCTGRRPSIMSQSVVDSSERIISTDSYDREDSFVDDRPLDECDRQSDMSDEDDRLAGQPSSRPAADPEEPFYVSQNNVRQDGSDDELPDFASIMETRAPAERPVSKMKATRRILDSDDEDEHE